MTVAWLRQLGANNDDYSSGVSSDGLGNVYISGGTEGTVESQSAGSSDAYVIKYDAAGVLQWARQTGTSQWDEGTGVSADDLGNVYISGLTNGSLGGPNAGRYDAFVSKYDSEGTFQWTRQLGSAADESCFSVSADSQGNVYITGMTYGDLDGPNAGSSDAFVSKYDAQGTFKWTRQLGTSSNDASYDVTVDGLGHVYIAGVLGGSLGGPSAGLSDAFVSKYDAAGELQWSRQLGTRAYDSANGVSTDGLGNVYIAGSTDGKLGGPNAGELDAFVSKFDASGALQWTRQLGTSSSDTISDVSADGLGNVYILGETLGSLGGPNAGDSDAFVSKFDATGVLHWTYQLGTSAHEGSFGVSTDGLGSIYISGATEGEFGGPLSGDVDTWVAKIVDFYVPEPSSAFALIAILFLPWRKRLTRRLGLPRILLWCPSPTS